MKTPNTYARKQQGAALVVSLVLLIVLTLYGLSTSNLSLLQVKMTTSNNDSQIALSAAEAAATRAIADIEALTSEAGIDGTFFNSESSAFDLKDIDNWLTSASPQIRTLPDSVLVSGTQEARYFIVYLGEIKDGNSQGTSFAHRFKQRSPQLGDRNLGFEGGQSQADDNGYAERDVLFKVVGMGTGVDDSAMRLVETFYRRPLSIKVSEGTI